MDVCLARRKHFHFVSRNVTSLVFGLWSLGTELSWLFGCLRFSVQWLSRRASERLLSLLVEAIPKMELEDDYQMMTTGENMKNIDEMVMNDCHIMMIREESSRLRRYRPSTTKTTSGAHGGIVQSRTEVDLILTDFDKDKREAIVSLPRKMLVKYTAGND
ncbi:hypothetical protein J6590_091217 [Homalodisca vitripennis]|nr:hypothetical protein J6590_104436 [Homalodisca vitripennis]KAG8309224.1 hypothetical protein J6590_091217 [Homalodisca vitripennis]